MLKESQNWWHCGKSVQVQMGVTVILCIAALGSLLLMRLLLLMTEQGGIFAAVSQDFDPVSH